MTTLSAFVSLQQLCSLMLAHGVTRCVISPGSRNAPLINMIAQLEDDFSCRSVCDERSAGFVALGWASQAQAPVAVIVTSGSALLNLHPAVAEAYYRNIPLLVISADRPSAWIGQQDGQTLPQHQALGNLVRLSVQLPADEPQPTQETLWQRNRLINEALLALQHRSPAPVHINIPLAEPLWGSVTQPLPPQRVIERATLATLSPHEEASLVHETLHLPRRLILLGQSSLPPQLSQELLQQGFVILGDSLSNAHQQHHTIAQVDLILGATPSSDWSPDLLITYGGHIVSKRLKNFLRKHPPRAHWHLSPDGALIDTYCCLTRCLEGSPDKLWDILQRGLAERPEDERSHDYARRWYEENASLSIMHYGHIEYSGLRLIAELINQLPTPATLHLANSLSVRLAQFINLPHSVQVECNRGTNGIEGSLSSALGYALGEPDAVNYLIIGDLSFFYDMNALGLQPLPENLRILLINNGGGALFKALPARPIIPTSEPYIIASHNNEAGGWARSLGINYRAVYSREDWQKALPLLLSPASAQKSPLLIEAFTDAGEDIEAFARFIASSQGQP